MNWFKRIFCTPKPESVPEVPEAIQTWDLEKMKHRFEQDGFKVSLNPVNFFGRTTPVPVIKPDPYDVRPAFDMRYEQIKIGPNISLSALKKNVRTFKFQTKEVFTDPKRVARRHWHRYMHEKRREQIMKDSFLFV
jgi:hypothetical protein